MNDEEKQAMLDEMCEKGLDVEELTAERFLGLLERATSAEARAARADRLKAWLEEQRDKQVTSAMKKIYQAIIDKLDERLEGN